MATSDPERGYLLFEMLEVVEIEPAADELVMIRPPVPDRTCPRDWVASMFKHVRNCDVADRTADHQPGPCLGISENDVQDVRSNDATVSPFELRSD